ncbi:MAG: HAMP domain-containing protein [Deltaproteobacteria bacterium]|nr:HAMP domain-containing protein [Deltaproteobacteria bacterium]
MKLKLGAKIGAGLGILILIAVALGGLAIFYMSQVGREATNLAEEYVPEVALSNNLERYALLAMYANRGYGLSEDPAFLQEGKAQLAQVKRYLEEAKTLASQHDTLQKLRQSLAEMEQAVNGYDNLLLETEKQITGMQTARQALSAAGETFMQNNQVFEESQKEALSRELLAPPAPDKIARLTERLKKIYAINEIIEIGGDIRLATFKAQATRNLEILETALTKFKDLDQRYDFLKPLTHQEINQKQLDTSRQSSQSYTQAMREILAGWSALQKLNGQRDAAAQKLLTMVQATAQAGMTHAKEVADLSSASLATSMLIMLVGLAVALLVGIVVAVILTRGITRPVGATGLAVRAASHGDFTLRMADAHLSRSDELGDMARDVQNMVENLSNTVREVSLAAETVASSAAEISQGNQDLSNRTQQQASAIEETASALEEMTGSVKQNAANSSQANDLAKKTAVMAQEGSQVVGRTITAMEAVTESSKKISEIINVVNEIAFQTNLLALNAAVEAARAGEAGRGFAVVAGEVRNLAGRSSQAAKEIQALITDSVGKVEQGNELVAESGRLLNEIINNVQAVADTVGEITAASQEQAQGIEEVNKAVAQMDEGVQQNAALVEEAASSSENMASAAEELRSQTAQFKVNHGSTRGLTPALPGPAPRPAARPTARPAARSAARPAVAAPARKAAAKPTAKNKPAEDDFLADPDLEGFEEF